MQIEEAARRQQRLLFRLGAPEPSGVLSAANLGSEDLAYRSFLTGKFQTALQLGPPSEISETVASLFLVTHGLADSDPPVQAIVVGESLLARVRENSLELFSWDGAPLQRQEFQLGEPSDSATSNLDPLSLPFQLEARGGWVLVRDQTHSAAFRYFQQRARGYLSEQRIEVTESGDLRYQDEVWTFGPEGELRRL